MACPGAVGSPWDNAAAQALKQAPSSEGSSASRSWRGRDNPEAATASWGHWHQPHHTRPHRANTHETCPTQAETAYHQNLATAPAAA